MSVPLATGMRKGPGRYGFEGAGRITGPFWTLKCLETPKSECHIGDRKDLSYKRQCVDHPLHRGS